MKAIAGLKKWGVIFSPSMLVPFDACGKQTVIVNKRLASIKKSWTGAQEQIKTLPQAHKNLINKYFERSLKEDDQNGNDTECEGQFCKMRKKANMKNLWDDKLKEMDETLASHINNNWAVQTDKAGPKISNKGLAMKKALLAKGGEFAKLAKMDRVTMRAFLKVVFDGTAWFGIKKKWSE